MYNLTGWGLVIFFGILGWLVQNKLKSKFKKYSQMALWSNMSGAEIAHKMLLDHGIRDVKIVSVGGQLTDQYHPGKKTVNLSNDVYHGRSAAAAAVAAHEVGHAVQHAEAYAWLGLRSAMVPAVNISNKFMNYIWMAAIFGVFYLKLFPYEYAMMAMIVFQSVIVLFSLVTLPVEYDASSRAMKWMSKHNVVTSEEHDAAKDALSWAARTYVVAAIGAIAMLLYYVMRLFGGRD
jgi:Zn-dependent membrane protease YugP